MTAAVHWHCNLPVVREQLGCTLVLLHVVRPIHDQRIKKTFHAIHSNPTALPWRCLFFCPRILASYPSKHPFRDPRITPYLYRVLPSFLSDLDGAFNVERPEDLPKEYYSSEYGGFPRYIMVYNTDKST